MGRKRNGNGNGFGGDDGKRLSPESSSTRLFEEDYLEVQNLCVGSRKESEVIRELVRRALYAKRYRQATNDPAFRELLRAFDDRIGLRINLLEKRLTKRMEIDFGTIMGLLGYVYVAENFAVGELKEQSLQLAPEDVTDEQFFAAWTERLEQMKQTAWAEVKKRFDERNKRLGEVKKPSEPEGDGGEL